MKQWMTLGMKLVAAWPSAESLGASVALLLSLRKDRFGVC